jgi:activator of HSP90 ATPase
VHGSADLVAQHAAAGLSRRRAIVSGVTGTAATRISRYFDAPRAAVYRALLDSRAIRVWRVPQGMTRHVHAFDPREGVDVARHEGRLPWELE